MGKPDGEIIPGNGYGFFFGPEGILQRHPFLAIAERAVCGNTFLFYVGNTRLHVRQCDDNGYGIETCQLAGI